MVVFNWLHLTDLHLGMKGLKDLWPNVEVDFFKDLEFLISKVGPLDLVLFTGDLVQRGNTAEFNQVNLLLDKFWRKFSDLGSEPKLLAVPGNHDLVRPKNRQDPALVTLMESWNKPDVYQPFWDNPKSSQRKLIDKAFANYMQWWQSTPVPKPEIYSKGMLPGDFSATLEKEGVKLGVVGLNSTFLQLIAGDRKKKLALNVCQFNATCGDHGPDWANEHDLCLLLTHQPPDWLTEEARKNQLYGEIHYPSQRFALHLFGHMHKHKLRIVALGGSDVRRQLQGCSLFGMERWEGDGNTERLHGYSLGQLKIEGSSATLRIWPRKAVRKDEGGWDFDCDQKFAFQKGEVGIEPIPVTLLPKQPKRVISDPVISGKEEKYDQATYTLKEHKRPVECVAISTDGQTLVSGGTDSTIKVWDLHTGKLRHSFEEHKGAVKCVAISSDGQILASGSADSTIKVWDLHTEDLRTGKPLHNLKDHIGSVESVAISSDGKTLASGSRNGKIRVWDLQKGQLLYPLTGHNGPVKSVAFRPDGGTLFSGSDDEPIKAWDLVTKGLDYNLTEHIGDMEGIAISSDGQTLASGSRDGTIRVWNIETRNLSRTLPTGHLKAVISAIISDKQTLAIGSIDLSIRVLNINTGEELQRISTGPKDIRGLNKDIICVAISSDGQTLASGERDGTIKVWKTPEQ